MISDDQTPPRDLHASTGRIINGAHWMPARVYWEDTDAGGIVYYGNYLRFFERGRTEMLRLLGFSQESLRQEQGIVFAVKSFSVDYFRPARLDDELMIKTQVSELRRAGIGMVQEIWRNGEQLTSAFAGLVCMDPAAGKPRRLPSAITQAFAIFSPTFS